MELAFRGSSVKPRPEYPCGRRFESCTAHQLEALVLQLLNIPPIAGVFYFLSSAASPNSSRPSP